MASYLAWVLLFILRQGNPEHKVFEAVQEGNIGEVKMFLIEARAGVDVDVRDKDGFTALMWACAKGRKVDILVASLLLDHDADVNAKDNFGMSPLSWACHSGNIDLVSLLLDRGANIFSKNEHGHTAIDVARQEGYDHLTKFLQDKISESSRYTAIQIVLKLQEKQNRLETYLHYYFNYPLTREDHKGKESPVKHSQSYMV